MPVDFTWAPKSTKKTSPCGNILFSTSALTNHWLQTPIMGTSPRAEGPLALELTPQRCLHVSRTLWRMLSMFSSHFKHLPSRFFFETVFLVVRPAPHANEHAALTMHQRSRGSSYFAPLDAHLYGGCASTDPTER